MGRWLATVATYCHYLSDGTGIVSFLGPAFLFDIFFLQKQNDRIEKELPSASFFGKGVAEGFALSGSLGRMRGPVLLTVSSRPSNPLQRTRPRLLLSFLATMATQPPVTTTSEGYPLPVTLPTLRFQPISRFFPHLIGMVLFKTPKDLKDRFIEEGLLTEAEIRSIERGYGRLGLGFIVSHLLHSCGNILP